MHWNESTSQVLNFDKELVDYLTFKNMYALLKDYIALLVLEKYGGVFID